MGKRTKTKYPGVFFRNASRVGGKGTEKIYYILFKKDGRLIEEKVGRQYQDNMTPAKAAHIRGERIEGKLKSRKEIRQEAELEKQKEANRWTIHKIFSEYTKQKEKNRNSQSDINRYNKHLFDTFGSKTPGEIATLEVDAVRIQLLKSRSPQTVKHVISLLRRIINWGVKKGLCAQPDPAKLHFQFPRVDNKKTEDLTPEQLKRLLEAIASYPNRQVGNLMKLALYTGMRRSELFRLKWEHIDFKRGFIRIVTPKGGLEQTIPLNEAARRLLAGHKKTKSPYVFPGREGAQRKDINHQTNLIKKAANLPEDFRPLHGLRHVYASMLASSGKVDMYTLQKLLTHKSPQMTQRYAHLRDEALQRASQVADELFTEYS